MRKIILILSLLIMLVFTSCQKQEQIRVRCVYGHELDTSTDMVLKNNFAWDERLWYYQGVIVSAEIILRNEIARVE